MGSKIGRKVIKNLILVQEKFQVATEKENGAEKKEAYLWG